MTTLHYMYTQATDSLVAGFSCEPTPAKRLFPQDIQLNSHALLFEKIFHSV